MLRDPRVTFLGNVCVTAEATSSIPAPTEHIALPSLAPYYTHILYAYGASDARHLHVPGSAPGELANVASALDFVQWYNGHPDAHGANAARWEQIDGSTLRNVAVVGAGNVAIDVARILLRQSAFAPADQSLRHTDVPQSVLDCLRSWQVENVGLFVRRGAAQLAFTNKELREMLALPHAPFQPMDAAHLSQALAIVAQSEEVGHKRAMTRLLKQLQKGSACTYKADHKPRWGVHLLRAPKAFHGRDGRVVEAEWAVTQVSEQGQAIDTGDSVTTDVDLVLSSVGYRSRPLPGTATNVPFDDLRAIIPNERRRVVNQDGHIVPGMYVAGWLATGPVGVIVSTMIDAYSAADEMLHDWRENPTTSTLCASYGVPTAERGLPEALEGKRIVHYDDWLRIDAAEKERGRALDKPREKFVRVQDMLDIL